ncbi:MAG: GAF domain-containing protein [Deltaproteobacteria bacterium]|nr:GAF domain-containing protein [Deltaproteobacteria bacterium]
MSQSDYLRSFLEIGRLMSQGANSNTVMNLIARRIAEQLEIKGCLIKMVNAQGDRLEILANWGLSEAFLFSVGQNASEGVCFQLPDKIVCVSRFENGDAYLDRDALLTEGIKAFAVIPIEIEHRILAMVGLFAGVSKAFTEDELVFAEAMANRGVLAIFWKRRFDRHIDRERYYLSSFQEVSSTINATLDVNEVLSKVVVKVTEALRAKGSVVRLLDPKTQKLYLAKGYGVSQEFLNKGPVDAQKSIADNLAGKIVVVDDVLTDPRLQYPAETAEEGIRKVLSIPLMIRGRMIGVLRVFTSDRPRFTNREINFASALAQQCAFAIENARIYERVKYEYQQLLTDLGYAGSSH